MISNADTSSNIYIVAGLGNPGPEYQFNRHNIGFMVLNHLAYSQKITFTRLKFSALITDFKMDQKQIILAKPQKFMNLSGISINSLLGFYKIPLANFLVVYDDVDLPLGQIRMRPQGGSAGHKGIQSIIDRTGRQDFPRLRIGIDRPSSRMDVADYVLKDFSDFEKDTLDRILDDATRSVLSFIESGISFAMNNFN